MAFKYLDLEFDDETAPAALEERDSQIGDLTAERDSLTERNTALTEQLKKVQEELAQTKKLNYTLASQVDAGRAAAYHPGDGLLTYLKED